MKKEKDLPKGWQCDCGVYNKFPLYVYAHWDTPLMFTCICGRGYEVLHGIAEEM
jgi:hypothetical protein